MSLLNLRACRTQKVPVGLCGGVRLPSADRLRRPSDPSRGEKGKVLYVIFLDLCLNIVYTLAMEAKIQKWGNSFGIRIPMPFLKDLSLGNGSVVEIEEEDDRIVIKPLKKVELESLLSRISDDNLHSETDWGAVEGEEIW